MNFENSRKFCLDQEMKLHRLFLKLTLKLMKYYLMKRNLKIDRINQILENGLKSFVYYFKFLTVYINMFGLKLYNKSVLNEELNNYPSLNDSYLHHKLENQEKDCVDKLPKFLELLSNIKKKEPTFDLKRKIFIEFNH